MWIEIDKLLIKQRKLKLKIYHLKKMKNQTKTWKFKLMMMKIYKWISLWKKLKKLHRKLELGKRNLNDHKLKILEEFQHNKKNQNQLIMIKMLLK